jgi:hypothetical protein
MIERIDMLLDQTLDLEKGGEQIPLVASSVNGIGQRLVVVERLECSIEAVSMMMSSTGLIRSGGVLGIAFFGVGFAQWLRLMIC